MKDETLVPCPVGWAGSIFTEASDRTGPFPGGMEVVLVSGKAVSQELLLPGMPPGWEQGTEYIL